MGFSNFFSRQAGNPSGLFGRWVMSTVFDRGNVEINNMMKGLLDVRENDRVLEIGFGTGKLMHELGKDIGQGVIMGVDISETMVRLAGNRNRRHIADGRVKIHHGNFENLDFQGNSFDKICSANTIFFWPDPVITLRKSRYILKPGGRLVIGFEDNSRLEKKRLDREVFRIYSPNDVKDLMERSGFSGDVEIVSNTGRFAGLCCVVAHK